MQSVNELKVVCPHSITASETVGGRDDSAGSQHWRRHRRELHLFTPKHNIHCRSVLNRELLRSYTTMHQVNKDTKFDQPLRPLTDIHKRFVWTSRTISSTSSLGSLVFVFVCQKLVPFRDLATLYTSVQPRRMGRFWRKIRQTAHYVPFVLRNA